MTASRDDVLSALGKISAPDGVPLPSTGKLSEIVATDGKVFFSITVDAAAVEEWETVRERAEHAVRALPGVESVMVALTAERAAGAAPRPQAAPPRPRGLRRTVRPRRRRPAKGAPHRVALPPPPACRGSRRSLRSRRARAG